ncbi:MAG: recombinase family protein, partial [Actinomycetota bacterium]|nr:recombinase family protein [Actinomycetota bacterium]
FLGPPHVVAASCDNATTPALQIVITLTGVASPFRGHGKRRSTPAVLARSADQRARSVRVLPAGTRHHPPLRRPGLRCDAATKTLVPEPTEATTVRRIFSAYADEHLGATGLANHLNGAGVRNRGDRLWSNQTVLRVLRNPVYVGKISHGDEVYDGKHPSIVDDDLFEQAVTAATAEVTDNRPRLEAELVSTGAQLRDTEAGLNHYLRAFETGEMPAAICSPRVTELTQRRDELATHRKELAEQIEAASPQLPTPEQLRALCTQIRRAIEEGPADAVKQLLRELIDRVEITPDRHAYPYFWVPLGCETGTPSGKPAPNAQPVPTHQGDTGWLFVADREVFTFGPELLQRGLIGGPPAG